MSAAEATRAPAVGDLGAVRLRGPVVAASGCLRVTRTLEDLADLSALGAWVSPTVALASASSPPGPRWWGTPAGLVHPTSIEGPGISGLLAGDVPWFVARKVPVIVSVAAATLGDYAEIVRHAAAAPGVIGVELRLAPPGARGLGFHPVTEGFHVGRVVAAVRGELPPGCALLAKLPALPDKVVDLARAAVDAGADAVTLVDAAPAYAVDPATGRPPFPAFDPDRLSLSGPALLPVALRSVHQVRAALPQARIVASGGVRTGADVAAHLAAGASAVQVGTTLLRDPVAPQRLRTELSAALAAMTPHPIEPSDEETP
ncbi:alpha-hydroxy-acid oxidizing protein [Nocardioides massiliensis]|uniref:Dihydroorotate dehydrogenase (NAD+) catalytic subunit n=1 Tax=Nocardioides massiliensis TaxID=1325935 RepID=A0ABT9NQZ8_9ACTN|nr:alpha-hydroxy-acid oxidizing protein [Nocardioides massiliensis]MDP9822859.1 dihydroorotate dehydrogenase (NAD+) catalytic subunit [Nocardioides massiliensis]